MNVLHVHEAEHDEELLYVTDWILTSSSICMPSLIHDKIVSYNDYNKHSLRT